MIRLNFALDWRGLRVGSHVKPSPYALTIERESRDKWVRSAPEWHRANVALERAAARRGVITQAGDNGYAYGYTVRWSDGGVSSCLADRVEPAEGPAPRVAPRHACPRCRAFLAVFRATLAAGAERVPAWKAAELHARQFQPHPSHVRPSGPAFVTGVSCPLTLYSEPL